MVALADISGDTRAFVIGHPIAHSLSPHMHSLWMAEQNIAGRYEAVDIAPHDLETAITDIRDIPVAGFNVTIPHKEAILPFLDKIAPMAQDIGAVNTVIRSETGGLTGFNTDGLGMMAHLKAVVPDWPIDRPILIVGAGGAARAAAVACRQTMAPFMMMTNRTRARADAIAEDIGLGRITVVDWEDRASALAAAGLVINTTALGMDGHPPLDMDMSGAAADTVIYDIVYTPLETPLITAAKARGLRTVDGLGMLIHQGAAAFKLWFKVMPDTGDAVRTQLLKALGQ